MKCVFSLVCCIIQLLSVGEFCKVKFFSNIIDDITCVNIYQNGKIKRLNFNDESFCGVISQFKKFFDNTREMPAFGVALHDETINNIQSGVWVELEFDGIYKHNEMAFEKLLIQVQNDYSGFNIIRFYNGKYEGRCFYFDIIKGDMSLLYAYILNM